MATAPIFGPDTDAAEWGLWTQRELRLGLDARLLAWFSTSHLLEGVVHHLRRDDRPDIMEQRTAFEHTFLLQAAQDLTGKLTVPLVPTVLVPSGAKATIDQTPMKLLVRTLIMDRLTALIAHGQTLRTLPVDELRTVVASVVAAAAPEGLGREFDRFNQILGHPQGLLEGRAGITCVRDAASAHAYLQDRWDKDTAPVAGVDIMVARTKMEHSSMASRLRQRVDERYLDFMNEFVVARRRERLGQNAVPATPRLNLS